MTENLAGAAPVLCHTLASSERGIWTYDDAEGVSRVPILALAQDERGYLWLGTARGPVRFDGMEWGAPASLTAPSAGNTWALDTAEQGALWIATSGDGLWRLDTQSVPQRRVATVTSTDGLADDDVHALCRDTTGALWVGTHQGLSVVAAQRVTAGWTAREGIPEAGICALCADPAGGVWAGSLQGLLRFDRGGLRAHLTPQNGLPDAAVYALCTDARGRLWVGTRNGLAIFKDGRVCAMLQDGLPSPEIRTLCADRLGRVWAGTARGLVCIEHGRVRGCWTRRQGLPSSSVWALLCDDKNRVWVGTEGGVALMSQQSAPLRALPLGGDEEGGVYSIATDHRGQTWIGTADGLVTIAADGETTTTPPPLPPILSQVGVWAVHRDGVGRLWVAGRYGGLYCLDATTGEILRHCETVNAVRCMLDDPAGRLWVGTLGAGLACVDPQSGAVLHRLGAAQGMPGEHIAALCLDGRGRLWAGTLGGGLVCVEPRRGVVAKTVGADEGLPHLAVSGLALGPDGGLWGTTQGGGLCRVDLTCDRVSGVWTMADGLPSDTLASCAFDGEGALWIGTTRGLTRFLPATGTWVTLGRPHGLPGESCQQGVLWLDARDRLWVGTTEGAAVIAPGTVPSLIPPCAVYLTGVRIMGRPAEMTDGREIEDSNYDLAIDYGAVTFVAAAQVVYRTQLVGLEDAWSAPQSHRFARYTNLRPGDYTFRVAARNWGGQWSEPAEWRFRVVRNRDAADLEHARQRAEAAEAAVRVRNEVLSVVAHDLRAPLTGILGHADLLQRRLERAEPPAQDWLRRQVDGLRASARRMSSMVNEITDVMHLQVGQHLTLQRDVVDVADVVRTVTRALEAGKYGATVAVDAPDEAIAEGDRARLERVLQNVLSNAVKYSPAATPIQVAVQPRNDEIIIQVQDHGVGIPDDELSHIFTPYYRASTAEGIPGTGLGLAGARAIVEQHGGQITLQSRVGEGTTVTVALPRRAPEMA